jgi:protein-disulfide isomerase
MHGEWPPPRIFDCIYIVTVQTKRILVGIVLTAAPVFTVHNLKQTAWGTFLATPTSRQKGDPHAPVSLVEYSDFQCPMCAHVQPTLHLFLDTYKGKVRLAYKYFPLMRIHKHALASATAAECAAEQNQFWPYQDQLFSTQMQWAELQDPTTVYLSIAKSVNLDTVKFGACLSDPTKQAIILQDEAEGKAREISATPTLFVNDQRLVGQLIETDGARTIEKELRGKK